MFYQNGTSTLSAPICDRQRLTDLGNLSEPRIQMSAALDICAIIGDTHDSLAIEHLWEQIQAIPFPSNGESFPIHMIINTIKYRLSQLMGQSGEQDRNKYEKELSLLRMEIDRVDREIVGSLSRKPDTNIDWGFQNFVKEKVIGRCLEGKLYFTPQTLEFLDYRWKIVRHIGQLKKQYHITAPVDEARKQEMIDHVIYGAEDVDLIRILTALFNYIHETSVGIQREVMSK